jgi:hypothetical protein
MHDLARFRMGRNKRISSWDQTGGNRDYLTIEKGETRVIAQIGGPGCIRHIWVTIACEDPLYCRKILLRAYWDGEERPSVEVPIGDFFGVGHAAVTSYQCAMLNMSQNPGSPNAAMNCFFPMPFESARLEVVNECEAPIRSFYYYVDHELYHAPPRDQGRFHAKWRRENPCDGIPANAINLDGEGNYLILQAEGRGHYVGCNLSVHNLTGGWWGEGDDMFFIDDDIWPPSLHGTGSEDYFCHAWGMQDNAFLYNGTSYHVGPNQGVGERITVYRHHILDPVAFHRKLRVSIEHGHANDRSDDYSSTAYWYQTEPHTDFWEMPPAGMRGPREG